MMVADPWRTYYLKGYADQKAGKRNSRNVPHNYKLSYVCGRYDAASGKPSKYEKQKEQTNDSGAIIVGVIQLLLFRR